VEQEEEWRKSLKRGEREGGEATEE